MRKMKYELYDRIIKDENISRLEIRFIFWLAAHQDTRGYVTGIYYDDIVKELNCSVSGFYLIRDNLIEKGYIQCDKSDNLDMDIKLYDNCFEVDGEVIYKNYVDLDINMFKDNKFFECKVHAIRLAMYFVKRVCAAGAVTMTNSMSASAKEAEKARKLWFNPVKFAQTIKEFIKVRNRSIKEYLESLKRWIENADIQHEGTSHIIVTVLSKSLKKNGSTKSYAEQSSYMQKVKMFCRRKKIEYNNKNLTDTADLIKQYRNIVSNANSLLNTNMNIITLICNAISNTCECVLNSYNVHKSLRNMIEYNIPGIFAEQ